MTVLPCSDGITALPGAQWLTEVLAWVPDGVDPWVWLAPDEDLSLIHISEPTRPY